jgi:hypothetical protein
MLTTNLLDTILEHITAHPEGRTAGQLLNVLSSRRVCRVTLDRALSMLEKQGRIKHDQEEVPGWTAIEIASVVTS